MNNKKNSNNFFYNSSFNEDELAIELTGMTSQKESLPTYSQITNQVKITVEVQFIEHSQKLFEGIYFWAYHIKIENNQLNAITLRHRHWQIIDANGNIQEVDGQGVVGKQPKIEANSVFNYSSGVHLFTNSGIMKGNYLMQKDDGGFFEVQIPQFSLDDPSHINIFN